MAKRSLTTDGVSIPLMGRRLYQARRSAKRRCRVRPAPQLHRASRGPGVKFGPLWRGHAL